MSLFEEPRFIFWPVGTGDSTTIVVDEDTIFQLDIRHLERSEDDDDDHVAIVDRLVDELPQINGKPYLSTFALTHPDKDHILGFENLIDRVTIGELWFTPRIFKEIDADLCDDAIAFKEEAERRVKKMIETGGDAEPGDRLRLIGYDRLLEDEEFAGFPYEYLTVPGNAVTELDRQDCTGSFRAFVHAPFKDEDQGDRNNTSLAMQVVLGDDPSAGGALLLGDIAYPRLRRIFDETKDAGNEDNLAWQVLLTPHHCSKSAMYHDDGDGQVKLKQDILDDLAATQVGDGYIIASSEKIPARNEKGDNPPHSKAKQRYEEIADGGFLCTHENGQPGEPLVFDVNDAVLDYNADDIDAALAKDNISAAVAEARGSDEPPSSKVAFG